MLGGPSRGPNVDTELLCPSLSLLGMAKTETDKSLQEGGGDSDSDLTHKRLRLPSKSRSLLA